MNIDIKIKDKEWFCQNIKLYQTSLYRLALGMLQNPQDAEDALQDTILIAYNKLDTLRDPDSFRPWVMKILSNTASDMLRKRKSSIPIDEMEGLVSSEATDLSSTITLWEAVCSLNKDYRSVVVLFYYEDLTIKDISTITGLSQGTVKTRLSRARQQLKNLLSKGEVL